MNPHLLACLFSASSRTLQGGCKEPGDFVKDTNPQATPTDGCPEYRDSCVRPAPPGLRGGEDESDGNPGSVSPFDNGPDPFHNYMDYTDDVCQNNFTPDQEARMWAHWYKFREPNGPNDVFL